MLTFDELAEWLGNRNALPADRSKRFSPAEARRATEEAGWTYRRSVACIGVEKGGVGKTFLSINAASALAMHGVRVLLMDFDPQCCATNYLLPDDADPDGEPTFPTAGAASIRPSRLAGLDISPARPELRSFEWGSGSRALFGKLADFIAGPNGYDAILFDVPPFFGRVASFCYMLCDCVILPVVPDAWSLESISLTMRDVGAACGEAGRKVPDFFILPNKIHPRRRSSLEAEQRLREEYADLLLPFSVRESAVGLNAMNDGFNLLARRDARSLELREPIMSLARRICPPIEGVNKPERSEPSQSGRPRRD